MFKQFILSIDKRLYIYIFHNRKAMMNFYNIFVLIVHILDDTILHISQRERVQFLRLVSKPHLVCSIRADRGKRPESHEPEEAFLLKFLRALSIKIHRRTNVFRECHAKSAIHLELCFQPSYSPRWQPTPFSVRSDGAMKNPPRVQILHSTDFISHC